MESEFAVESCVPGTTSTKSLGCECRRGTAVQVETKRTHTQYIAVMRRSTIVGHVPRKISAACSLFQADQLLSGRSETEVGRSAAFWQIRDRGTIVL